MAESEAVKSQTAKSSQVSQGRRRPKSALLLDGGGVRGLASLLVLERLMTVVNDFNRREHPDVTLKPHDVFDIVAGTSTGGLIAIMLGKLDMSIEECIKAYKDLSVEIFGSKRFVGRFTFGIMGARYAREDLEASVVKLLRDKKLADDLPMLRRDADPVAKIRCSVVCNEHERKSKFRSHKPQPKRFCSTDCKGKDQLSCQVKEAAQATAAAMTYFDIVPIGGRWFSDGGVKYNNPSETIYDHYTLAGRVENTLRFFRKPSISAEIPHHDGFAFDKVMMLNIGTGTESRSTPPPKRHRLKDFLTPKAMSEAKDLGHTLIRAAIASEQVAESMKLIVKTDPENVSYVRLSPDNEICWIKLDRHDKIGEIDRLTTRWLNEPRVKRILDTIAEDLVRGRFGPVASPPASANGSPVLHKSLAFLEPVRT